MTFTHQHVQFAMSWSGGCSMQDDVNDDVVERDGGDGSDDGNDNGEI